MSIAKVATEQSYDAVGDVIHYTITATNTGNVAQNLTVTDPNVSNVVCTPANGSPVAPGASMTCTASHTITQADIDAGSYLNTSCVDAAGATQACDSEDVPAGSSPALSIAKTVTGVDADTTPPFSVDAAGDVIWYSILVTNTGNQTLTGVSVTDPRIANLDCDPATAGNQTTGFTLPRRVADLHRDVHGDPGRHRQQRRRRRRHRQHRHRRQQPDRPRERLGGGAAGADPGARDREDGDRGRRGYDAAVLGGCGGRCDQVLDPGHEHGQSDADRGVGVGSADREPRLRPRHGRQPDDRLHAGPGRDADLHRARTR